MGQPEHSRATAGPYTLIIPPNGRATLYEADGAGVDHEVPFGVNSLDVLVQFAGEVIRLNAMIGASASLLEAARLALPALEYEAEQCKADDPIRVAAYALRSAIGKTTAPDAPEISVRCGVPAAKWRPFYNVSYPKLWGIETNDPAAIEAGLEIIVAPCMPEHAAKTLADAYNFALRTLEHKR